MSTTIDQRVVEMRFDNAQFERNVSTTMSSLDKLKQKLNLDGANKGLDNVNAAAKNNNIPVLGSAVEAVSAKFSALQVMGVTALANITNSAVNAGKRIVKSLTIDPVKTGFQEYELKMGSVQTIMAGTGESLATVNKYLAELNEYSDKTIYSFKDMTSNIGKFTNAGVSLEDAVAAIKGISNEAALSGANANEASRAMYNFSQALSSGFVKLIDWKSIELANMATKGFKEELIKTAVEVGTLKKSGDNWYKVTKVVSNANASALNATKNFNDSLGNQWMTTEVLTKTLARYADETTDIGKRASEAATEVKTFTMLMDTLKEAAQSGWAQTWELLVGDFEEAKKFFTELSDIFGGILGESADRRNSLLEGALSKEFDTSTWETLTENINKAGVSTKTFEERLKEVAKENGVAVKDLIEEYGSLSKAFNAGKLPIEVVIKTLKTFIGAEREVTDSTEKVNHSLKDFQKVVRQVVQGKFGNGAERMENLAKAGYDAALVQQLVNKCWRKGKLDLSKISEEQLKNMGYTEEQAKKAKELVDAAGEAGLTVEELIAAMEKPSGRELLLDSLMNVIKAIQRPLQAVGEALRNIFSFTSDDLYNVLEAVNKFTEKLVPKGGILDVKTWDELTEKIGKFGIRIPQFTEKLKDVLKENGIDVKELIKKYGSLAKAFEEGAISFDHIFEALTSFGGITESLLIGGETLDKLRRTFEGLFAAIKIVATILSGPLKIAFKVITKILESLGLSVLDVTAGIGDGFVELEENVSKVVDFISEHIFNNIMDWLKWFRETEFFKTVSKWFEDAGKAISDAVSGASDSLEDFSKSDFAKGFKAAYDFLSNIVNSIANSQFVISIIDGIRNAFGKLKEVLSKFKLPEFNLDNLTNYFQNFTKIGEKIGESGKNGMAGLAAGVGNHLKDNVLAWDWTVFKETALEKLTTFWLKTGDTIKAAFEKAKEIAEAIKKFIFGTEDVTLNSILELAEKILGILILIKALNLLNGLVEPFDNITDALNNFASSLKWKAIADTFKGLAIALGVFTLCIIAIASMNDIEKAKTAAGILVNLLITMGVIVLVLGTVLSKLGNGLDSLGAGVAILAIIGAVALLVNVIEEIDKLKLKDPVKTFGVLFAALIAMTMGVKAVSKAGGSSFRSVAAILTMLGALKLMLDVIDSYDEYDWTGKSQAIKRMFSMLVGLAVAINIASRGVKAGSSSSGLAFAILAMVFSLKLIAGSITEFAAIPEDDLKKGGIVVGTLLGVLTLMMAVANATSKGTKLEKGQKSVNSFKGFAIALLAAVAAIWLLGMMDTKTLEQGGKAVGQILLLMTGMLAAVGQSCSGLKIGTVITMLISFGLLFAELALIVKYLEDVPWQNSLSSAGAIALMLLAMAGVMYAISKLDAEGVSWKDLAKVGAMLGGLSLVMVAIGHLLRDLKDVPGGNSVGNAIAISAVLGTLIGIAHLILEFDMRKFSWKKIGKVATMIGGLTLVMIAVGHLLRSIKDVPANNAAGQVVAISGMLGAMVGLLWIISTMKMKNLSWKNLAMIGSMMAGLTIIVVAIAHTLRSIQGIDPNAAIGQATAISMLLVVMTGVLAALTGLGIVLSKFQGSTKGLALASIALILLGGVIYELGFVLSEINKMDIGNARPMVETLATLLVVMTGVLAALALIGLLGPQAIVGVVALGLLGRVVLELGTILNQMKDYGIENAGPMVEVLAELLKTMTKVLAALAVIGLLGPAALGGVLAMAALGLVVWELGAILKVLKSYDIGNSQDIVDVLASMLNTLAGVLPTLTLIGVFAAAALAGVLVLGVLAIELAAAMWGLSQIKDTATAKENVDSVVSLFGSLADMLIKMAECEGNVAAATIAIGGLTFLVEQLASFAGILGMLDEWANGGVGESIQKGMEILKIVARGLGEMISEFGLGLTSQLVGIGENLSAFAESVQPFIKAVSGIGDDVAKGAGNLTKAILGLLAADFINTVVEFWGSLMGDGVSLSSLADELNGFATGITPFVQAMAGIDTDAAAGIEALCSALTSLTGSNLLNSLTDWITGSDGSLSSFGESVGGFAKGIKDASTHLKGITDEDVENIKRSATAGEYLAELNKYIPAEGGHWQTFAGTKDLASWGEKISAFADCLTAYSSKVSGNSINEQAIKKSTDAATHVSDLNTNIPTDGGLWQEIAGAQDLSEWGTKISAFADALVDYSSKVSGKSIDKEAIIKSADAADALAVVNEKIPTSGGLWQLLTGEKSMDSFGAGLSSLATGLLDYATTAEQIDQTKVDAIKFSGKAIDELKLVNDKLPDSGGTWGMLWGEKDPISFGAGISKLSQGISDAIDVAVGISEDDITAISSIGTAVDAIKTAISKVPTETNTEATSNFKTAVSHLKSACDVMHSVSTAEYDFSGLSSIKTGIKDFTGLLTDLSTPKLFSDMSTMNSAVSKAASAADTLQSLNGKTYGGIDIFKGAVKSLAETDIGKLTKTFSQDNIDAMTKNVNRVVNAFANGLRSGDTTISTEAGNLADVAINAITNKKDSFKTAGSTLMNQLADGIVGAHSTASDAGSAAGKKVASGAGNAYWSMYAAGNNLGSGLVRGINAMQNAVYWAGYYLGKKAVEGEKDGQASNSPSKATIKAGKWIGEGLVIGIDSMGKSVYKAGESMGQNAVSSISGNIRKISDAINTDIDAQPTIRPVLDLSDVRAGAGNINSLLDFDSAIGVRANVNAIGSMMSNRSNSNSNAEVVSAINKLRNDLGNVNNTTYSINGVTYDDGSNISSAVQTIVRAARIERRV